MGISRRMKEKMPPRTGQTRLRRKPVPTIDPPVCAPTRSNSEEESPLLGSMASNRLGERLHHTGFVVPSVSSVMERFSRALGGGGCSEIWHDPLQGVRVAFIYPSRTSDPSIELIEPAGPGSPVQKFLDQGGGLHHLCYEIDNLDEAVREATARGLAIIRRPQPAVAFGGRRIAWFHLRGGLLVEYLERVSPTDSATEDEQQNS
jgi:methylmalonyl-CoA/ethylmalonyl-CoA epimerase